MKKGSARSGQAQKSGQTAPRAVAAATGGNRALRARPKSRQTATARARAEPALSSRTQAGAAASPPLVIPPILLEGDQPAFRSGAAAKAHALPDSYGTGVLRLIARDPHWLYAHWDFSPNQQQQFNALSVHHHLVILLHQNGLTGQPLAEAHVHPESQHWFIHVPQAEARYLADLGYYAADHRWVSLAVSNPALTPPDALAGDKSARFATIPPDAPLPRRAAPGSVSVVPLAVSPARPVSSPLVPAKSAATSTPAPPSRPPEASAPPPRAPDSTELRAAGSNAPTAAGEGTPHPHMRARGDEASLPCQPSPGQDALPPSPARPAGEHWVWHPESLRDLQPEGVFVPAPFIAAEDSRWPEDSIPIPDLTPEAELILAEMSGLTEGRHEFIASADLAQRVGRQAQGAGRPVAPAEGSSFAGGRRPPAPGFRLEVNAELVIYGATEPNARVTIAGRPIQLRPDGSFSYRFALPDGRYELPVQAVSADGEVRQARLEFYRGSEYHGAVGIHPQDPALPSPAKDHVA